MTNLDDRTLARLFGSARSQNGWTDAAVSDAELKAAYDLAKWGPTSMNTQPMRVLFLRSAESKQRLVSALSPQNVDKALTAPVVAVIAHDLAFPDLLSRTFPHNPGAESIFLNNPAAIEPTAFRNGSLQAAYLMLALRAVGLDVGPMSGFDPAKINGEFFANSPWRVNFLCGIGHGDPSRIFDRLPRLEYDEISRTL